MSAPQARSSATRVGRARWLLLFGAPLAVVLVSLWAGRAPAGPSDPQATLAAVGDAFTEALARTETHAAAALVDPASLPRDALWAERLEGAGVIEADDDELEDWSGTPAEPPQHFAVASTPRWWLLREGVSTRLLVRGGPDDRGRVALVSYLLQSQVQRVDAAELIPERLYRGYQLRFEFVDSRPVAPPPRALVGDAPLSAPLVTPDGLAVGRVVVEPLDLELRAAGLRRLGLGWALVLFVALVALLFDWPRRVREPRGYAIVVALIVAARWVLLLFDAPSLLLPRTLGTASLFGSSSGWGLLGSPGDVVLTGAALLLFCLATRASRGTLSMAAALVATLGCAAWITWSLAWDSRLDVLAVPTLPLEGARIALIVGWALAMLGPAELAAMLGSRRERSRRGSRVAVVAAFAAIATIGTIALQSMHQQLVLERLRSEFAPRLLDQRDARRLALIDALRSVQAAFRDDAAPFNPAGAAPEYLAYYFWVDSPLFYNGLQSSLDFFSADGTRISHFGFDLPALPEADGAVTPIPDELVVYEDYLDPALAQLPQRLLVGEAPITVDGEPVGRVVARVIDEPGNLAFLPDRQPYLAALGAGAPLPIDDELSTGLHYVLFAPDGSTTVSTLSRPPARDPAWPTGAAVVVDGESERYHGLAVADGERLHLLLVPAPSLLTRIAAIVRIVLIGLLWVAIDSGLRHLVAGRGLGDLWRGVRRSFYRKQVAALLVASVPPLLFLSFVLSGFVERRAREVLEEQAVQFARRAQVVLEGYGNAQVAAGERLEESFDDVVLFWMRDLVGQELSIYIEGRLEASSNSELFGSGLLSRRLHSDVQRRLFSEGRSYLVDDLQLGPNRVPVGYARVRDPSPNSPEDILVAVPLLSGPRDLERFVGRVREMVLLATVFLVGLLVLTAAALARTVARPVRALVGATARIGQGDYSARLEPQTADEIADLVAGFNGMAASLADQRADLERRRAFTESLVSHATTGVLSTDAQGRLLTINPAARELLGSFDPEPSDSFYDALGRSDELKPLAHALAERRAEPRDVDLEIGGEPRRYRSVRIDLALPGSEEVGALVLLEDVTDLMRRNQLEAWAEMARAIAHEIKNPLTPIQLSAEHLRRMLTDKGVVPERSIDACIDTVIKQVQALHEIAGDFSTYAKLPVMRKEPTDAVALMRAAIGPYAAAPPDGVTIVEDYGPTVTIVADGRVLTRALINLIENALHAMPDGGTLTVGAHGDDGGDVVLSVNDTGTGIDADARRRLFEPYFSTRSSGTGLGLAIVKRSIEAHDGRIEVESEPGEGTTFRITLPTQAAILRA